MNIDFIIQNFFKYWNNKGCLYLPASNCTMGAATFHPQLFFGIKNRNSNNLVYLQPCMRRADGMYGKSNNRLILHHQLQVIMQPIPVNIHSWVYEFLQIIGINRQIHLLQEIDNKWISESLGAFGTGWEVRVNTLEVLQYTYFDTFAHCKLQENQKIAELSFGLERLATVVQGLPIMKCKWSDNVTYGDLFFEQEKQLSEYYLNMRFNGKQEFDNLIQLVNNCAQSIVKYEYFLRMNDIYNCLDANNCLSYQEKKDMIKIMSDISHDLYYGFNDFV